MRDFLAGLTTGTSGGPVERNWEPYRALYLHLPFCTSRCRYCDFATQALPSGDTRIDAYVEDLVLAIRRASREGLLGRIETVYLGGGTPSHVGLSRLSMLLYTLSLSMHLTPEVECSMEANPESLTSNMVRDLWALGVNRLSIGVQSFDDEVLRVLGRAHDAAGAQAAIQAAHERFENVSVDLMCGIPGQSRESFAQSVQQAIELGVTHVSVYPLAIEEGTPFDAMVEAGDLEEPNPDMQADMMLDAQAILEAAGFKRYEVASYAKPGYSCRHNQAYWTGVPYLGLGHSAVTMRQVATCRQRLRDGALEEELSVREMLAEDLMLAMRMSRGVDATLLNRACEQLPEAKGVLHELCNKGLVEEVAGAFRPTQAGWLRGNEVYAALFELA